MLGASLKLTIILLLFERDCDYVNYSPTFLCFMLKEYKLRVSLICLVCGNATTSWYQICLRRAIRTLGLFMILTMDILSRILQIRRLGIFLFITLWLTVSFESDSTLLFYAQKHSFWYLLPQSVCFFVFHNLLNDLTFSLYMAPNMSPYCWSWK